MNFSRLRGHNHHQVTAFHLWLLLNYDFFLQFFLYAFQNLEPLIGVSDLPSTKKNRHLRLVLLGEKTLDVADFHLKIVLVGLRANLYFLYLDYGLFLFGFLGPLVLLVFELSVIHYLANRRIGVRGHFDEIQMLQCGQFQCFSDRNNSKLLAVMADHPDFRTSNLFIHIGLFLQCRFSF